MMPALLTRPPDVTLAAAIRGFVLEYADGIRRIRPEVWRGELGYLAAVSPAVRRLALELTDRQAIAIAISDTTAVAPEIARLQGIALAGVFHILISEGGRRAADGESQEHVADEVLLMMENVLDELDRWLTPL
jgi:hypothetical protein